MNVKIKGTNEIKTLTYIGCDNKESDITLIEILIGHNVITGRQADKCELTGVLSLSRNDFEWWNEYLTTSNADYSELKELSKTFNIEWKIISARIDQLCHSIYEEHIALQSIIKSIKEQLNII